MSTFPLSGGWELLLVNGPVGEKIDKKLLPYVLIHGPETYFAILTLCSYHFYRGISKALLLESYLSLFSLFLSSGQLSNLTAGYQGTLFHQKKQKNETCGTWHMPPSFLLIFIPLLKGSHSLYCESCWWVWEWLCSSPGWGWRNEENGS